MQIKIMTQAELDAERAADFARRGEGLVADTLGGEYETSARKSKRNMIVEHGVERLLFNFPPRTWNNENDTNTSAFDAINLYFAQLPPNKQASIFAIYQEIHNILRATNMQQDECEDLIEAIRPLATQLFEQINPGEFYDWVWVRLKPRIPVSVETSFDPDTMPGTRERTYLLEDYRGLIPLAIIVRMAVPIWFDFIALTKSVLSAEHKDMLAYSLIENSWPAQSLAMKRLEQFVDHTIGNDRNSPQATLLGIGSDDYVHWALSSLVVNRLPVVDVLGANTLTPVVSALYNHIRHRISQLATSQPAIKNKFAETSYSADENNQSYLENFRNRIALTVGQEAQGDFYLEQQIARVLNDVGWEDDAPLFTTPDGRDEFSLIERVAPGIDYELVRDALASVQQLHSLPLVDEQITIAAWLFHPYSQVRAVGNLRKERIVSMLGLAQAVLLHHGKIDLAILVSAAYSRNETQGARLIGESIVSLRAADRETYRSVFPLEQRSRNQKKVRNFVFEDVYELVRSLQEYEIRCSFSDAALRKLQGNNPSREYYLRKDAVMMFMEYVKYLATRPVVRISPEKVYEELLRKGDAVMTSAPFKPYQYQH